MWHMASSLLLVNFASYFARPFDTQVAVVQLTVSGSNPFLLKMLFKLVMIVLQWCI